MTIETAHQRARRERAERRAERLHHEAEALHARSRAEVAEIPFGQPVLVGHHSERRHRRAVEKSRALGFKAYETSQAAREAKAAARAAGRTISSDDPEALEALRRKLEGLEATRDRLKEASKAHRRGEDLVTALRAAGLTDRTIASIPGGGFPSFLTTNLGAEIRRVKKRLEDLEARATATAREPVEGDGWRLVEELEDNRTRIYFDGKPADDLRDRLKASGWRWSPNAGAWQRQATPAAWSSALRLLGAQP